LPAGPAAITFHLAPPRAHTRTHTLQNESWGWLRFVIFALMHFSFTILTGRRISTGQLSNIHLGDFFKKPLLTFFFAVLRKKLISHKKPIICANQRTINKDDSTVKPVGMPEEW
jgi:hypothetical protein